MPLIKLQFRPGLNRDQTNYSGEGSFYACDKVRFRSGYPEKIGGWVKSTFQTYLGVCRQMWNWFTSFGDNLLALGTNIKVYIDVGGNLYDITPLRETTGPGDATFLATDGSDIIEVSDNAHGAQVGDYVTFSNTTSLGGNITDTVLDQEFEIIEIVDADTYKIKVSATADALDIGNGGANTIAEYQINIGLPGGTYGYGWGSGTWSRGTWSSGTTQPIFLGQTDWWFVNFDNDLIMNRRDKFKGPIYIWERGIVTDPTTALNTRAILLDDLPGASDVPLEVGIVLVSQNDKHLIALGATQFGSSVYDPLLIRWANQDEPENWTPLPTNSAGFLRLSKGSRIVSGVATRQEILVWTEGTLNSLQFTGTTDVFGLQELADNVSIMGSRAVTSVNNVVYWMGRDKFFVYSGRAETLPCTLRRHVFSNFNYEQSEQTFAGTSEGFNEVWWFYCTSQATSPDAYVVYNYQEQIWYYGTLNRTYWLDSPLRVYPVAVNDGYIYNHEDGTDDDGVALESYIQSSDIDIGDGENFMLIKRIIPDVSFETSKATNPQVQFEILPRNFPGAPYQSELAQSVTLTGGTVNEEYTNQIFMRARARQMALKISSNTLGVAWQLGSPRIEVREDGER
jgi:hypothetical protein